MEMCSTSGYILSDICRVFFMVPWYVPNTIILRDLQTAAVKEEIYPLSQLTPKQRSSEPHAKSPQQQAIANVK
jgi:hypothetical protein